MPSRITPGSTGFSATFTGRDYQETDARLDIRQQPAAREQGSATQQDPGFSGVEIERVSKEPSSNEKTASFTRNGTRYHLKSTLKSGLEIYHWFTQDQWEKIADHMDALGEGMGGDTGLNELVINLSKESALGHLSGNPTENAFETRAFPANHEGMQEFIRFINPLIDVPVLTIPNRPYAAVDSDRSLFPATSKDIKAKETIASIQEFGAKHLHKLINAIEARNTHGIDQVDTNDFTRSVERRLDALEAVYGSEDENALDMLEEQIKRAETSLSHTRQNGDAEEVTHAHDRVLGLKAKKAGLENKEALRLAIALHHAPTDRSVKRLAEAHSRTSPSDLEHCLQNAFDARLILCEKEGLIDSDGKLNLNTEDKVKKYQELSDIAALLIPHRPSGTDTPSEEDALINVFYAGGASLNALTSRAAVGPEESTTYPIFPKALPPKRGAHSRIHEEMRSLVERVVYESVNSDTNPTDYEHYGAQLPQRAPPEQINFLEGYESEDFEDALLTDFLDREGAGQAPGFEHLPENLFPEEE